ncbi:MAG: COP23 domain-containing protein [Stigonema ocellatum SAG 48.90 = DSM 106950]|nr:COP23 domain-containing protein [Stigonema ocellatum SAG 48.90 = DSM 106950]
MSSQSLKFLFLGSIGLSLFLGNSGAIAQVGRSSGDVVVPTESGNGTLNTTPSGTSRTRTTTVTSGTRFSCQFYDGQYTVMYQPESRQGEYFAWANPRSLGGGWDTQKRCQAIAQRLESYRPDGLVELQTSVENGQNVLCVTTESNPSCRIVLTVPPEKDPNVVRSSVFQNLTTADNGQQTIGVNTYTSSGGGGVNQIYNMGRSVFNGGKNSVSSSQDPINLKPFLDRADRGTGTKLRNGVALRRPPQPQTGYRLDPSKFR